MLLKSKYIQPGVQVSVLIKHHLYSCSYTKLGKGGARKAFFVFIVKYLFWSAVVYGEYNMLVFVEEGCVVCVYGFFFFLS